MLPISRNPEPWLLDLLDAVSTIATNHAIPFFVVGAMARDVVFELVHNIEAPRRTEDVDLGLRLASWDEFNDLIQALVETGRFTRTKAHQRLLFDSAIRLDVVPFGDIAESDQIQWPPDFDVELDVAGFDEAFASAVVVRLREDPELDVRFASPAGLAAMKIIAWGDRSPELRSKDAEDLAFITPHYLDIEGVHRIADEHPDWLEGDFDYDVASATLLGVDMRRVMREGALSRVLEVLSAQVERGIAAPLVLEMSGPYAAGDRLARSLGILAACMKGLSGSMSAD